MRSTSATPVVPEATGTTPNFGGFYAAPFIAAGISQPAITLSADFDHDGKSDLASIDNYGNISVLLNDGKGGFLTPITSSGNFGNNLLMLPLAFAADFNGDGYPDIAIGASGSGPEEDAATIAVRFNQKDGTFGQPVYLSIPSPTLGLLLQCPTFGIVENPTTKFLDIVGIQEWVSNSSPQLQLVRFVNNGSGSFTVKPTQTITLPSVESPYAADISVNFIDTNKDGIPDLLLERDTDNGPTKYVDVLLGNSDGTFKQPGSKPSITTSASPMNYGGSPDFVHAVSLTGDPSKLDLILNFGYSVSVALGNGDGTFQAPKSILTTANVTQLLLADLNSDGKIDLITVAQGALVSYPGNGDGTFGIATGTAVSHGGDGYESVLRTVVADFNGDGKLDFANGDSTGHIEIGLGNGDGTFAATPLLLSAKSPILSPSDINITGTADLNGDGLPDVIAFNSFNNADGVVTGLANPSGGFTWTTNAFKLSDFPEGDFVPIVADFNGDGKQDAFFFNNYGNGGLALSNGDGTFKTPLSILTTTPAIACPYNISAATGDINGDGKVDLVYDYSGDASCNASTITVPSGIFVALGKGDGTFKTTTFTPIGTGLYSIAMARFHGGGKPLDLVLSDYSDTDNNPTYKQYLLTGKGDGTFSSPITIATQGVSEILTDDFNQDGNPDLTFLASGFNNSTDSSYDGAFLYASNGDGTFAAPINIGFGTLGGTAIYADVNGDGIPDLIGDGDGNTPGYNDLVSVYLGTGKGAFAATPIQYFLGNIEGYFSAGKFLGDNTESILVNSGAGTAFFMNQGGTSLTLTPSATTVASGTTISLTAHLTATLSDQPEPAGSITYYDGTTKLGTEPVGTELTGIKLATGTHKLTASYSGDTHFNPNTSVAASVTVTAPLSLTLSPTSLAFGSVKIGTTSATQIVTIKNNTSAAVPLSSITFPASFIRTASNCGPTVPNAAACTVTIAYRPTAVGPSSGNLVVTSTAPGSPFTVALTGTGTSAAALTLSPISLAFGSVKVGTTSATQIITIKNNTSAAVPLSSITFPAPFIRTASNCGPTVPNAAACTVTIAYRPTAVGPSSGNLVVTSSAAGSPFSAALTGTATSAAALTLSPASLAFGSVKVGTTSATQVVTIKNNTSAAVPLSSITFPASFIRTASNCGPTVPNAAACTITIAYRPTAVGASSGNLVVTSTAAGSPFSAALTGTGD